MCDFGRREGKVACGLRWEDRVDQSPHQSFTQPSRHRCFAIRRPGECLTFPNPNPTRDE